MAQMSQVTTDADSRAMFKIHCPACGRRNVDAAFSKTGNELLRFLPRPLWRVKAFRKTWFGRERFVRCLECGKEIRVRAGRNRAQIIELSPDELGPYLDAPATGTGTFLAAITVLTFWVPILGVTLAWKAYRLNQHTYGLPMEASFAALIMATPFTAGLVVAALVIPIALLLHVFS